MEEFLEKLSTEVLKNLTNEFFKRFPKILAKVLRSEFSNKLLREFPKNFLEVSPRSISGGILQGTANRIPK